MMVVTKAPISDVPELIYAHSGHSPPISRDSDHRQFQNKIKSAELKSLDGGFKKANGIVHGGSGVLNSKPFSLAALENNKEPDASIGKTNTQVKRPALGHKPARFTLGKPPVDLDPSLNIDHLQDPVKFFSTYKNLQYAKDEIQRYTGGNVTNMNDCKPFAPCCLWSGISGQYLCFQKPVSYMHDYSSTVSENDDTFVSSKEALQENNLCPAELVSHQETVNSVIEQQNKELAGSISKTDNRINELVDKLLSEIIENLDGDGALSLLPEGLQIRPVDRRNNVPDFSGTGKTDLMDLEEKLRNNQKSLARIQKVMRGLNGKTPVKSKVTENLIHTLDSPTTPKSPFAALSLLNKHISQSKPSHDPFLVLDIDLLPSARNTMLCEDIDQLSEQLHKGTEKSTPDKQKSPTEVEATALPGTVSKNVIEGATHSLLDKSVNVHSSSGRDMLQEVISYPQYCISIGESSRSCTTVVTLEHGSCDMDNDVKDSTSAVQLNINTGDSTTKNATFAYSLSGQSDSTFTEDLSLNGQQIVAVNCLKQHNKALRKGSTKDINRARRTQKRKRRKQMANSQSLLEAGTYWESGVRRSKRKRTRPLEFWKGERFLYGRVHESLATVIGIKCISLATGSESSFKVSSYVSDKYKDLVELAALH